MSIPANTARHCAAPDLTHFRTDHGDLSFVRCPLSPIIPNYGKPGAVPAKHPRSRQGTRWAKPRRDWAEGNIQPRQTTPRGSRGLASVIARSGGSDPSRCPLGSFAGHPAASSASSARVASMSSGGTSGRVSVSAGLRRPMRARSTRPGSGSEARIATKRVPGVIT